VKLGGDGFGESEHQTSLNGDAISTVGYERLGVIGRIPAFRADGADGSVFRVDHTATIDGGFPRCWLLGRFPTSVLGMPGAFMVAG